MSRLRAVTAVVGVGILALALAITFGTVSPPALEFLALDALVLTLAAVAAVVALAVGVGTGVGTDREVDLPEPRTAGSVATTPPARPETVAAVDDALERPPLDESQHGYRTRLKNRRDARNALSEVATRTLVECCGLSRAEALERLEEGTWSDDPRANAFLSDETDLPRRIRFLDWLWGRRYQRGLEATLAELERRREPAEVER
ncbi:DUF7269 family protein [Natronobiforma cellulositropha]|uniref:DUF7269 family protein n=1 Tax=Natronobiforma cellulositropha TaxID=1679076 RepID=UPI0021D5F7E4|nr:hypothetical protein [Natronobiforma cellulositropha]